MLNCWFKKIFYSNIITQHILKLKELVGGVDSDEQETPPAQYVFKPFVALSCKGQQIIK